MQPPLILPCQFKDFFCDNDPTHLTVIYIVCSSSLLLSVLPSSLSGTFISRRENKLCINESAAVLRSSKPSPAMTNWLPRKLGGCQPGRTCKHVRLSHTYTHVRTVLLYSPSSLLLVTSNKTSRGRKDKTLSELFMHINETLHCQVVFSSWCSDGARLIVPCVPMHRPCH